MAKGKEKGWEEYGITGPEDSSAGEFEEVYHTAHLTDAVRIFEDGEIRSSLVWDESILRNSRTCVAWVSPEHLGERLDLWQHPLRLRLG